MFKEQLPYALVYLTVTFLSAVSQVLLKKAAMKEHKNWLAEYLDWRVIIGYMIFVLCTFMTMFSYRGLPMSIGPILETTGYIYITFFGVTIFHEKLNRKKIIALAIILAGIVIYAL